jgi:type IV pilus assembly protein PilM
MAVLKRCLGVDLGASRIKVAEMVVQKTGIRLNRLLQADVDIPPGVDEEERGLRLTRSLRDLLKANKITTKDAVFAVPGQSVFQRPIKLPKTSPERLRRIIEYEARQQIPFPLDQTRFEFQVFESEETPEEVEVLLAAIKRETINTYVRLFRRAGLRVAAIGVSFFALFNYHQLDQGRLGIESGGKDKPEGPKKADKTGKGLKFSLFGKKKKADKDEAEGDTEPKDDEIPEIEDEEGVEGLGEEIDLFEEVKAYVNLGATMMDLSIGRQGGQGRVGFCRSIPHAGNELTRTIQRNLKLDSFRDAEEIKCEKTVALSAMYEIEGAEQSINAEASEAVTKLIDRRIIGELRRSLDFYISQPDGVAVDGIVLSGGQARLPYLASYIEEKLGLPVEIVEEFHNESLEMGEGLESADWGSGALAVGLALQGIGASAVTIDFLPEELKTVREFKGKYRETAVMVAALVAIVLLSRDVGVHKSARLREAVEDMDRFRSPDITTAIERFKAVETERTSLIQMYERMNQVVMPRDLWLTCWVEIILEKPPEVVIDHVSMRSDGGMDLVGECETEEPVLEFFGNLDKRKDLFANVEIDQFDPAADPYGRFRSGQVFRFTIKMISIGKHNRIQDTPAPTKTP